MTKSRSRSRPESGRTSRPENGDAPQLAARPHYHGHRGRLRRRFERHGFDGLAEHEILELLLTLAIPRADVKAPAKALLAYFGSVRGVLDASPTALCAVPGIGSVTSVAFQVIRAAVALYLAQGAAHRDLLRDPNSIADFWRVRIGGLQHEVFEVAYLDSGRRLLRDGVERLQTGTIDRAVVYPRRVVEAALRRGAAGILLAHNHPNGEVEPSQADRLLTRAVALACETVSVGLVDHVVVSADRAFSFREAGLL